ncbi:MAG TPA: helix-turn-helix transcriptional regulator [Candidatus Tumulicola sp.]|jgi:DNA-binding XRE family transcriptional regulator
MMAIAVGPLEGHAALGQYLRTLRRRIPADSETLGSSRRLSARCGRRVTQEEIAEAVGVSRNWYRRLETECDIRASTKLLVRLALLFSLTPAERITLFSLAIPEIWSAEILSPEIAGYLLALQGPDRSSRPKF